MVRKSGSITENAGGFLELYYGSYAQRCDWWGGAETCSAPHIYTNIPTVDFTITTRNLNTANIPGYGQAGIILYLDEENVVFFGCLRDASLGDGIALEGISSDVGWREIKGGSFLDQYLRVRKVNTKYYFEYSADGSAWTELANYTNALWGFTPTKVGLFMKDWGSYTPYAAQFDFFDVAPDCAAIGQDTSYIYIIIAVVAIIVVIGIGLIYRSHASHKLPVPKGIQEQPSPPTASNLQSYQRPPASNQRFCEVCGRVN